MTRIAVVGGHGKTGRAVSAALDLDADATEAERASRPAASEAFFDRGPGYARLSGGDAHAEVDLLA